MAAIASISASIFLLSLVTLTASGWLLRSRLGKTAPHLIASAFHENLYLNITAPFFCPRSVLAAAPRLVQADPHSLALIRSIRISAIISLVSPIVFVLAVYLAAGN